MRLALSLWPLLVSAAILLGGNGLHMTLLAVRGEAEGFSTTAIGLFMSGYYLGIILGCRYAPGFVRDVGHIRSFTAFASIASAAALAHILLIDEAFWVVLRVVVGFSFAALQMILESWLNERATNATRGQVLSIYRITDFMAVTVLQATLGLFDIEGFAIFALISIGLSLALVPVALTRIEAPLPPQSVNLNLKRLWQLSPVAAAGVGFVGLAASSYWGMSPLFVASYGYEPSIVGLFVGALIFGGAVAQWPAGWLSDQIDRRLVLIGCGVGACAMALGLPSVAAISSQALILGGLGFGLFALPCFGLCVAHANDHAEEGSALAVNGGLLMLYGATAIFGSVAAAQVIRIFGAPALFIWIASVYAALVAVTVFRTLTKKAPEQTSPYVAVPRTTPTVFGLDPRMPDTDEGAPEVQPAK